MSNSEILDRNTASATYGKILPQFLPPGVGTPTLEQVLIAGNDTNGQDIVATSGTVYTNILEANTLRAVGAPVATTVALEANLDGSSLAELQNIKQVSFNSSAGAPLTNSINGVYNIDSGTLPFPVLRFSAAKSAGTQQKSLTLSMTDGEAIWSSQWEGYIPQNIRTKQAVFTIDGQGAGAITAIQSDNVSITPNDASGTTMTLSGSLAITGSASQTAPPVAGNDLCNKTYVDSVAGPVPPLRNVYYVSKTGNDGTGNGSIGSPYLTIQAAITAAQAGALPSAANPAVIIIAPGAYVENPVLTDGYITLMGTCDDDRNYNTKISGTITITATGANDKFNKIFAFENLLIRATGAATAILDSTVTTEHSVTIKNCRVIADNRAFYQASSAETRNILKQSVFSTENASALYTAPLVEITGSNWLEMTLCECYNQNDTADVLTFSGTSYPYKLGLSQFTSASSSAVANPIVRYSSQQTGVGSVGQCAFSYESPVNKTANSPNSTGWLFDTGSFVYPVATPVVNFIQNAFILNGIANTNLPVIAKRSTTTGTPIILNGAQIAAPTLASKIQAGGAIVHQSYQSVG